MKKFIAPTIRVIKYESNIICESHVDSGAVVPGNPTEGGEGTTDDWAAPSRRIFGE